ncbi:hypothetical protein [Haloferax sp. KTX1]|uniref:DUF5789 family protein n=1 Tax=Haloferax sp. KTX1 TaxID=2600597 RepID=UPI0011DE56AB|nr:hypothetical protein [Haloferax sp. KTX1]
MERSDLQSFLETEFTYPVSTSRVVERAGDVEISAPNVDDAETVETILDPLGAETHKSASDLYNTILGGVSESYVGRKFYDDRGSNPAEAWSIRNDQPRPF